MTAMLELVVATHAQLLWVGLDRTLGLVNRQVLACGHHYGIALPDGEGRRFWAKSDDQALTCYERTDGGDWQVAGSLPFRRRVGYVHQIAYANHRQYDL